MASKSKSRSKIIRLMSMAMTGYFYTMRRSRKAPMMGLMKYDPIIRKTVLFLESKKKTR